MVRNLFPRGNSSASNKNWQVGEAIPARIGGPLGDFLQKGGTVPARKIYSRKVFPGGEIVRIPSLKEQPSRRKPKASSPLNDDTKPLNLKSVRPGNTTRYKLHLPSRSNPNHDDRVTR